MNHAASDKIRQTLMIPVCYNSKKLTIKGGMSVEHAISGWSLFWLFVPMPLLILLSIITMVTERSR